MLTLAVGGLAPWWVMLGLAAAWVAVARFGWRARRGTPLVTMLLPIGYAGVLLAVLAVLALGADRLGWAA